MIPPKLILFFCLYTFGLGLFAAPSPPLETGEWTYFKEHFISSDGRVIDREEPNKPFRRAGLRHALSRAVPG